MAKTAEEKRAALLGRADVKLKKAEERNAKAQTRAEKANASIAGVNAKAAKAKADYEQALAERNWVANMPVAGVASAFEAASEADANGTEVVAEEGDEDADFAIV